ncbi:MAG: chaperone modulator CbpM [Methylomonas sp.]
MHKQDNLIDAVLEESGLTLEQLAEICAVEPEWIIRHIKEGLLEPLPQRSNEWRFSSTSLLRVRRIVVMERDFEAVPELAALVADMQEEIDALRRRLRRAGLE